MSSPTVLSDEEVKEAMQCLVAEVESDGETVVIKNVNQCLRNIEQALLQSPEIQQLHKDAERYRWLREDAQRHLHGKAPAVVLCDDSDCFEKGEAGSESGFIHGERIDQEIDAAMEKKP